jgi:hypothetical protein
MVAPVKLAPLMIIEVPAAPLPDEKLAMRGAAVKLLTLLAEPLLVVTLILPVKAVAGTMAVICVAELTVKLTALPPPPL